MFGLPEEENWKFEVPRFVQYPDCEFEIAYTLVNKINGLSFDENEMEILVQNYPFSQL